MGNTRELVEQVRQLVHEYQVDPITDAYIVARLNEAYAFIYNHYVKANDEIFGEVYPIQINAGQSEYDMPKELWTKRVEKLYVPAPPNQSSEPWAWTKVKKMQYSQANRFQTNRIRTYYPEVWCTLNNKIYVFPNPLLSYTARLIVSRKIPRLGVYCGRIVDLQNNKIFLDELNDSLVEDTAGFNDNAFISVADRATGELKALYSYSAVDTVNKSITLQTSPRKYATVTIQDITYTAKLAGVDGELNNITIVSSGVANHTVVLVEAVNTITITIGTLVTATELVAGIAASTLVTAVVSGTGATVQVASAVQYLIGGSNKFLGTTINDLPGTQYVTIDLDDIVCFGHATGVSIFGDAFDSFLKDWAVMRIRGALNESDPETVNSLKLQLIELTGDLAGRNLGLRMEMVERNNFGGKGFRR